MTSGVLESTSRSLETNFTNEGTLEETGKDFFKLSLDGDTSTEGSTSPDLLISNEVPSLNANAPAFTSVSSMTPVLITKNIDIGNERWKPTATIVEENINTIPISDFQQQPFIAPDGLYYWPADMMNGFQPQPVLIESIPNGTATVVPEQEPNNFQQHINRPELLPPSNVVVKELSKEDLKRLIQHQFEYYFSRENLANDSYLNSQMDGDQYVAISTVAKFNQVRKLTSDISLIVEALRESPYVQLDETEQKVRANMKRCIVILREIPESTPIEDVKALFAHPNCPKWISFEYAYNDSWYVTFECEDDAKKAYRYLREEVQSFQGRPLMARIKAKTLLSRTVYLPKNASSNSTATQPSTSSPSESITSHFAASTQQPVSTFTMAHPQMFPQHTFPFYNTPVNGSPGLLPATWIGTRFIQPEMRPKNNYNKFNNYQGSKPMNGQRPYFPGSKPRSFRNNYNSNKVPFHERNGNVEYEERSTTNGPTNNRRNHSSSSNSANHSNNGGSSSNGSAGGYRNRDDPRFVRHSGSRKEYRSSAEEGPRFQRLRERRVKDENTPHSKHDKMVAENDEGVLQVNGSLNLDLALENFPALPSPNSPNDVSSANRSAASLKELAANVLNESDTNVLKESVSPESPTSSDLQTDGGDSASENASPITQNSTPPVPTAPSIPKMLSYAQMAQKPNSHNNNTKDNASNDNEYKDIINANLELKKITSTSTKTDIKNNPNTTQGNPNGKVAPRKTTNNKGSPRSQRKKERTEDSVDQSPTSPGLKETYASKFGSATTDTKQTNNSRKPNTNNSTGKGTLTANSLSAPRPLMSQVISPPTSKLDEINGLQFQQQHQISFSDTVKKIPTASDSSASVPLSPKPVDLEKPVTNVEAISESGKEKS